MALPVKYSLQNVIVRWRATGATVLGVAMVVLVFLWMQAMAAGLDSAAAVTGDPRNFLVVRKGADAESSSQVSRDSFNIIQYADEIARDEEGRPYISADLLQIVYLLRSNGTGGTNVIIRGLGAKGRDLRPQVRLVSGRWPTPGNREVAVSQRLAQRFQDMQIGGVLKVSAVRELKVVGQFDGSGSAFESEAWMDADEARAMFSRESYSSLLLRAVSETAGNALKARLEADKRLSVRLYRETEYYKEQTKTSAPIRWMGNFLAVAMSIGAVFAAMNTMYASVGARTRELGTLRVLGFRRRAVVLGIIIEGAVLATIGGLVGCLLAQLFNGYQSGTVNFATFSETVFELKVSPALMLQGLAFAMVVGILGSIFPAIRAARLPVIVALKTA